MIILLFANKFPESWEPSAIWYAAAVELIVFDVFVIGFVVRAFMAG